MYFKILLKLFVRLLIMLKFHYLSYFLYAIGYNLIKGGSFSFIVKIIK